MKSNRSKLWDVIGSTLFSDINSKLIENFRAPGGPNSRLAAWDPYDKSTRYFKFLLFNSIKNKEDNFFKIYSKLSNTTFGNPTVIKYNNLKIDIDYFLAVEEFIFLEKNLNLKEIKNITEIGAGFGRTCHVLLNLLDSIETYTIIDLPEILNLSKKYLELVLSKEIYKKIKFIENTNIKSIKNIKADLSINIDSFQEMPKHVIDFYINNIISKSKYFYIKNPIGKYHPENVGLINITKEQLLDVYSLGYCIDIYDIFDEESLIEGRKKYCSLYSPGPEWDLLDNKPMDLFPYFQNAIYGKK